MRVSLAQWLKDNEAIIVPTWIRAVRRESEHDRTLTTEQLGQKLLLSYFDCFARAAPGLLRLLRQGSRDRGL